MATKKTSKKKAAGKFPIDKALSAPFVDEDIEINSRVEFFFITEDGTAASAVGRVCNIKGSLCCVQFNQFGCRKVPKKKLVLTTKAAPDCTAECDDC